MDLEFGAADEAFRAEVRGWLRANVPAEPLPSLETEEGFALHREWERRLGEARLGVVSWPEEYGGRGVSVLQWLIFEEEYYAADAPGRVSQNGINLLAPTLLEHMGREAPGCLLAIRHADRTNWQSLLERGEAELAIGVLPEPPAIYTRIRLLPEGFRTLMRPGHPLAAGVLDEDRLVTFPHLLHSPNGSRNGALDVLRRRGLVGFEPLDDDAPAPDRAPGPERQVETRQRYEQLETALQALAVEHREVLLLREVEDLSYGEIAATLGIAEGTVKSRIARARAALLEQHRRINGDR